mmetsp:Transcript_18806/g.54007  ORF Transcript_18806/g.54007 Transcript_18806/m.54007 type:complete len:220 (-) Transcript_18806:127-786(-)
MIDNAAELAAGLVSVLAMAVSLTSKLPQIVTVLRVKSAEGLAPSSLYCACAAATAGITYHVRRDIPVTAWAERIFNLSQTTILILLLWWFSPRRMLEQAMLPLAGYVCLVAVLYSLPNGVLWVLPILATTTNVTGVLSQIARNHRQGHTGALSLASHCLLVFTISTRLLTTWALVADPIILGTLGVRLVVQSTVLFQIVTKRKATAAFMARLRQKAKEA